MPARPPPKHGAGENVDIRISAPAQKLNAKAAANIALGEHKTRTELAAAIARAFLLGNLAVWITVAPLTAIDVTLIMTRRPLPADRVIDRSVVKTLIGATTVQIGAIMIVVVGYFFSAGSPDGRPWRRPWR